MTDADIDATKAPLMDHLIELRSRLIKALYAFFAAFFVCFYFSRAIYNILTWPYVRVVGAEKATLIATALPRAVLHQHTPQHVRRRGDRVSRHRDADLQVRRPRPLSQRAAGVSALSDRDAVLLRGRRAARLFRGDAAADPLLGLAAAGQHARRSDDRTVAEGQRISLADHDADLRLRHRVPAAGHPDAARPCRHHRFRVSRQDAPLCDRRRSSASPRS